MKSILASAVCLLSILGAWPAMAINGGDFTPPGVYPYIVSIHRNWWGTLHTAPWKTFDQDRCTGVLITKNLVLTSASCAKYNRRRETLVSLNATAQKRPLKYGNVLRMVEFILPHPFGGRMWKRLEYDIAIFEIRGEHNVTQFAKLPVRGQIPQPGEMVMALGIGLVLWKKIPDSPLKNITMPVIDMESCRGHMGDTLKIGSDKFCGRPCYDDDYYALCEGDWGGPALVNDTVVGIIARAVPCYNRWRPCYPSIFTSVAEHLPFIEQTISRYDDSFIFDDVPTGYRSTGKAEGDPDW